MFFTLSFSSFHAFAAEAENAKALKAFQGTWQGTLTVTTLDGRQVGTLQGRQQTWWKAGRLHSASSFSGNGLAFNVSGMGYVRLGRLYCVMDRDGFPEQTFWGAEDNGGVDWTNFLRNNQDFTERVLQADGKRFLDVDYYEVMDYQGQRGLVHLTGRLAFSATGGEQSDVEAADSTRHSDARIKGNSRSAGQLRAELAAEEARANDLEQQLAQLRDQVSKAGIEKSGVERQLAKIRAENVSLQSAVRSSQSRISDANQQKLSSDKARSAFAAEVARLRSSKDQLSATLADLQKQKAVEDTASRSWQSEQSSLQQKLAAATSALKVSEDAKAGLKQQLSTVNADSKRLKASLSTAQASVTSLKNETAGLKKSLSTATNSLAALRGKMATQPDPGKLQKKVDDLEANVTDLQHQKAAWLTARADFQANVSKQATELKNLRTKQTALNEQVEDLTGKLHSANAAVASSEKGRSQLKQKLDTVGRQVAQLAGQLKSSKASVASLRSERDRLAKESASAQSILVALEKTKPKADTDALRRELASSRKENDSLKKQLAASEKAKDLALVQAEQTKGDYRTLLAKYTRVTAPPPAEAATHAVGSGPKAGDPPAQGTKHPDRALIDKVIKGFHLIGIDRRGSKSRIILNGQVYHIGDIVDSRRRIVFVRIDPHAVVFSGPSHAEYRLKL